MKTLKLLIISLALLIYGCKKNSPCNNNPESIGSPNNEKSISNILERLNNATGRDILVVAHRGDWRNAPENSLQAIKNCIDLGVDMVEIDVRKTKDDVLVLMHDETLDRTTSGSGRVEEWTLDSLKTLYLKDGIGAYTAYRIPTLKEALEICKGNILVNLDKSYEYFDEVFKIMKQTGTKDHIIIKGYDKKVDQVITDFGSKLDSIIFMPIVNLDKKENAKEIIADFQENLNVKAIELVFSTDTSSVIHSFSKIKKKGSRIWVNSLWDLFNAGHGDEKAFHNPDSIYGWYIEKGINMVQTDRPKLLIDYLKKQQLHN